METAGAEFKERLGEALNCTPGSCNPPAGAQKHPIEQQRWRTRLQCGGESAAWNDGKKCVFALLCLILETFTTFDANSAERSSLEQHAGGQLEL